MPSLAVWTVTALLLVAVLTQRWWEPRLAARGIEPRHWPWRWWLVGYPQTALRIWATWRKVSDLTGLAISLMPRQRVYGGIVLQGTAVRLKPPRRSWPVPTRTGLTMRVFLHSGQTPGPYFDASRAMEHAWRVHAVRVRSVIRGQVMITVTADDPLAGAASARPASPKWELLAADVGRTEEGAPWLIDFRRVPHWLITGATQSGKSSLLASLVKELSPQPVALVGIDCKGGMELGLFGGRLSALATDRTQAIRLLSGVLDEIQERILVCREAGKRSVWDLPEKARPVPVVVIVDELAELYLTDGSRQSKDDADRCGVLLLRVAQLGAALGVHLVVAGQRVGSDIGPRVTALRAQLGGRVAHRAHDEASAEMTLGDVNPDAVITAQTITEDEQGMAVVAMNGRWARARSRLVTTSDAAAIAALDPPVNPFLIQPDPLDLTKGGEKE
ncbi:FtsK/SpoIIIE domain-containing protein [Streptomyces niveiscabiei]|uniref:FtsK/SpoIIIE domain-containing protein n=1 Tax=Streptomyces niveiscabiei TaxID=164115 RepID=A0ABW9I4G0_9ACTN